MIYLSAIIFGIVQGLTEFFPVSSSGHLLIIHKILPVFPRGLDLTFDVALHLSTLSILLLFYGTDIIRYARALWSRQPGEDMLVGWMIAVATIPAALLGYFFEETIVTMTRELSVVAVTLFIGGILFLAVERWGTRRISFHHLGIGRAFLIGCAQALALIPGMSRSGIIIIAGMALGLKRDAATHFAFLLAVPIITLAGIRRLSVLVTEGVAGGSAALLFIIGFVTAAMIGALCIRYLLEHVKTRTFIPFAVYRIALSVVLFVVILLSK